MSDFQENYNTWHKRISYAKSGVRIVACFASLFFLGVPALAITVLAVGFLMAEGLGIAEEWL